MTPASQTATRSSAEKARIRFIRRARAAGPARRGRRAADHRGVAALRHQRDPFLGAARDDRLDLGVAEAGDKQGRRSAPIAPPPVASHGAIASGSRVNPRGPSRDSSSGEQRGRRRAGACPSLADAAAAAINLTMSKSRFGLQEQIALFLFHLGPNGALAPHMGLSRASGAGDSGIDLKRPASSAVAPRRLASACAALACASGAGAQAPPNAVCEISRPLHAAAILKARRRLYRRDRDSRAAHRRRRSSASTC
jgi:hypothetical protein